MACMWHVGLPHVAEQEACRWPRGSKVCQVGRYCLLMRAGVARIHRNLDAGIPGGPQHEHTRSLDFCPHSAAVVRPIWRQPTASHCFGYVTSMMRFQIWGGSHRMRNAGAWRTLRSVCLSSAHDPPRLDASACEKKEDDQCLGGEIRGQCMLNASRLRKAPPPQRDRGTRCASIGVLGV